MCGKGSPPGPTGASTTGATNQSTSSSFGAAQGPNPDTLARYTDYLNLAQGLSNTPFNPATQGTVADLNPWQTGAGLDMYNLGIGAGDVGAAAGATGATVGANAMQAGNFDPAAVRALESPFTQDVVGATQNWFNNQNAIQSSDLLSQAIRGGNAFGGDRAGVAQAQMAGQQQFAQAPVIAGLENAGYTQALNEYNQLKQLGLAGGSQALQGAQLGLAGSQFGLLGAQAAGQYGNLYQGQQQRVADIAQQNAMLQSAYPFQTMNWYGSVLGGMGPLTGQQSTGAGASTVAQNTITNPPTPNPFLQGIGIASAGAGLLGKLPFFNSGQAKRGGLVGGLADGGYVDDETKTQDTSDDSTTVQSTAGLGDDDSSTSIRVAGSSADPNTQVPVMLRRRFQPIQGQLRLPRRPQQQQQAAQQPTSGGLLGQGQRQQPATTGTSQSSTSSDTASAISGIGNIIGTVGKFALPLLLAQRGGLVPRYQDGGLNEEDDGDDTEPDDDGDDDTVAGLAGSDTLRGDPGYDDVAPTPMPQPRPAGAPGPEVAPSAMPAWGQAALAAPPDTGGLRSAPGLGRPGGLGGGRPSVQTIPGFPQQGGGGTNWADWLLRFGAGALASGDPNFGRGLGRALLTAEGTTQQGGRQGKQAQLDAKPQMFTDENGEVMWRVGNKVIKSGIRSGAGGKPMTELQQRNLTLRERKQEALDRRAGMPSKTEETAHETAIRGRTAQLMKDGLRGPEARRQAIIELNATHPNWKLAVPDEPAAPAAPEAKKPEPSWSDEYFTPAKEAVTSGVTSAVDWARRQYEGSRFQQMDEAARGQPATAAPATPAPTPPPAAASASIAEALKAGRTTVPDVINQARAAIAKGKNRAMVIQELIRNGIPNAEALLHPVPASQ